MHCSCLCHALQIKLESNGVYSTIIESVTSHEDEMLADWLVNLVKCYHVCHLWMHITCKNMFHISVKIQWDGIQISETTSKMLF